MGRGERVTPEERMDAAVEAALATAPPLTDEQRERLAALLTAGR